MTATMNETIQPQFRSLESPNKMVSAAHGVDYAFRELGDGAVPLVLLQHFRGNLDYWDPALIDALAVGQRVIMFDNSGVGSSSGTTPSTVTQMARDAIEFLAAIGLEQVDILGFSLGSFIAQGIALMRPALVRSVILASSAPKGAAGMHGWAPEVVDAVGKPDPDPDGYLRVFFAPSSTSQRSGQEVLQRVFSKRADPDQPTNWQTTQHQYDAVCAWGEPNHALLQRLSAIDQPVFIANGDSDPMILPHYSHLLAGLIPQASVKIYPDAAHGFLFQHHDEFATDVDTFLDEVSARDGR
jgi:pimeloyl-ACP methyl ester carboxylesterase